MSRAQRVALGVVAALCIAATADGEPLPKPTHTLTRMTCTTDGGSAFELPPGYFYPEPTFDALDLEIHRLQDAETRLTAENKSLRASKDGWMPGWRWLATSAAVGFGLGVYIANEY